MIVGLIVGVTGFLFVGFLIIFFLMFKYGSNQLSAKLGSEYLPSVSIVIPTMNEEGIIEKRLQNILEMDYPHDKLEVLFIDNSTDSTPEIIKKYSTEYPFIKLQKQEKHGFNNGLNQGYSSATGEIVVKSDCTAFPRPEALKKIVSHFVSPDIGAVCGIHIFPEEKESVEKEFKNILYKVQNFESYFHSSLVSHGSFGAYRKELIPKLGEAITADDSEVVVNVVKNGYRAILDHDVKCEEQEISSLKEWEDQKKRRAAGVIRVLLSNIGMIFNRKYGAFAFLTIPVELFLLVISPILSVILLGLIAVYALTAGSLLIAVSTLLFFVVIIAAVRFSTKARAIYETYLSCFFGLFQAFTKKKTWK